MGGDLKNPFLLQQVAVQLVLMKCYQWKGQVVIQIHIYLSEMGYSISLQNGTRQLNVICTLTSTSMQLMDSANG